MALPRPTTTVYAGSDRLAHATTPRAAVRSAVKRIANGDYARADVYNDHGKRVATVSRFYNIITITTKRGVFK